MNLSTASEPRAEKAPVPPATPRAALPAPTEVDRGHVEQGRVRFPPWRGEADRPAGDPPAPLAPEKRVGFAIVGLGRLSLEQILPAFGASRQARPVALVSGSPEKLKAVAHQYGIADRYCHGYDDFERLRDNPAVQAVYLVLPNAMHREFAERAAAIGLHVLCEKPLATSAADAQAMVDACHRAEVKLMVAYRIHYQPHHVRARGWVRDQTFGRLVGIQSVNVQTAHANAAQQWRHKRALAGGGALPDIGLYCLNTARFVSGEEPREVYAQIHTPKGDDRFAEVEQTVSFMLRFPSGLIANCFTSYGAREDKAQRLNFAEATVEQPDAFAYEGQRLFIGRLRNGASVRDEVVLPHANQFACEIDHFADCVRNGKPPRTPGEEGLRDQVLMERIYASAAEGRPLPAVAL